MSDAQPPTPPPSRSPIERALALLALLALLASAAWSSWAILTDRADFGARRVEQHQAMEPGAER